MATEQGYYEGGEYGGYQNLTLVELVNDYMANRDPDDYDFGVPRHKVIYNARRAIRELYFDAMRDIRAIELDVSETLSIPIPYDYIDYVRISWVDVNGNIYPMAQNNSLSIAKQYLQDADFNLLFDAQGYVLLGTPTTQAYSDDGGNGVKEYNLCNTRNGFAPNLDRSKVYENGSYRIDKDAGLIRFSSEVYTKSVLIEYVSDGLYVDPDKGFNESDISIHKHAEAAVESYIYYKNIWKRRNVPRYAQLAARKEWYNEKRKAKRRSAQFTARELRQALRSANTWISRNN